MSALSLQEKNNGCELHNYGIRNALNDCTVYAGLYGVIDLLLSSFRANMYLPKG